MEDILIGTTDRTVLVFVPDPASTTGQGKTGLVAANITVTYTRVETDNDVVHTDVTASMNNLAALTDAHNDWGWLEVSATLSKGLYRLDLADAVFAAGAWYAVVQVTITTGTAAATPKAFRLVARNDLDGVRLGLTALPNAAANAAGGLPISTAGALDLDGQRADVAAILVDTGTTLDGRIPAALVSGRMDASVGAMAADVVTASAIAANAIGASELAADAVAEIADGVWDEAVSGHSVSGTYGEHHYVIYSGQVSGATSTTTLIDSGLTQADTDHWKGRIIIFLDGTLKYQATDITAFDPALDKLTFTAVTTAPTAGPGGTRYIIV